MGTKASELLKALQLLSPEDLDREVYVVSVWDDYSNSVYNEIGMKGATPNQDNSIIDWSEG